jgi:hypothetical protein
MPDTFIYIRASRLISVDELRNCTRGNPEATSVFGANDYRCLHHGPVPCFTHKDACTGQGRKEMWTFDLKPYANRRSDVGLATDA